MRKGQKIVLKTNDRDNGKKATVIKVVDKYTVRVLTEDGHRRVFKWL